MSVRLGPRASADVSFTALTSDIDRTDTDDPGALCICDNEIYPLYFTAHATDISGNDVVVGSGQTFIPAFGG